MIKIKIIVEQNRVFIIISFPLAPYAEAADRFRPEAVERLGGG